MTPDLSGQPLDELKEWLAITTSGEDALLVRLLEAAWQMCLRFTGTAATGWSELDEGLRHGLIRFAAHQYRARDGAEASALPAAVAALWRPWREVRL